MQHTTVTLTAGAAMDARRLLRGATSTNGLVSVRLHAIRKELESKLEPSIAAFMEVMERHAKRDAENTPVAVKGQFYQRTLTAAFEPDAEKAELLEQDIAPILADAITINVPLLSEANAEWITSDADIGAGLIHFMEK